MLLRKEVTQATDVELLTLILGNRRTADRLLKKASGSLFALLYATPHENGDLFCAQGSSAYAGDPVVKLQAARELAVFFIKSRCMIANNSISRIFRKLGISLSHLASSGQA